MFRFYPNTESFWRIFIAFTILYSMSYSVVAQELFRAQVLKSNSGGSFISDRPSFNFDYNLPDYNGQISSNEENVNQASLRISQKESVNLLVSYLTKDSKLLSQASINIPEHFINTPVIKSEEPLNPVLFNDNAWKLALAKKYYGAGVSIVSKGVAHIKIKKYINRRPVNINIIEVNRNVNPNLKLIPAFATSKLSGKKNVAAMVRANNAIAGVNASFFKQTNGVPLGLMIKEGEILSGPVYDRVAMGITQDGFKMARVELDGKVILGDGRVIKIDSYNQPRMLATKTILYSSKWGWVSPVAPKYGVNILIKNNEVKSISANPIPLDENSVVVSGSKKLLDNLEVGEKTTVKITSSPDWSDVSEAIGGGPYLIKDGHLFVDANEQKLHSISGLNPRTAIGYTKDNVVVIITVDGRQENSSGLSLYELAKVMQKYGCYFAMNLDGGTSTQMVIKNRIVNSPLVKGGAYVSNGLIVKEENI
ncbi:MAG: phosphodiester glycosidase family protein [bacterium]